MLKNANGRYVIIELLRVCALVGVLLIHLSGWFTLKGAEPSWLYSFFTNASRYSVPMFVFISAAVFYLKYENGSPDKVSFYLRRIRKIFVPYFFISAIYYIYKLSSFASPKQVVRFLGWSTLGDFLIKTFTKGVFSHLYFVPLIMMFYFTSPLLLKMYKRNKVIVLSAMIAGNILFILLMNYFDVSRINYRWTIFPFLIYVSLGFLFADLFEKIRAIPSRYILLGILASASLICLIYDFYVGYSGVYKELYSFVYDSLFGLLIILILLLFSFPAKYLNIINTISEKSYGVYLFHYLLIDLIFSLYVRGYLVVPLNVYNCGNCVNVIIYACRVSCEFYIFYD